MKRTILHCDCNGFYASVECILNPELKNVPMAVGGDSETRHGIILAKNELAKKYNIETAETIYKAKQKCPDLVIVPPHHNLYVEYSRRINEIYQRFTDLVEPFGIDESWLDVTGSRRLFGDGKTIADKLRKIVSEETGLTISVGVSFNKVFAKLGSDYKKPDATTVFSPENWRELIFPQDVRALLYVGKSTYKVLEKLGIKTIGDLACADERLLVNYLGKLGYTLHSYANGEDREPVRPFSEKRDMQSVGNGRTFSHDISSIEELRREVFVLSDSIAVRMRKHNVKCTTVQVHIKNPQFKTISRQKKLALPTFLSKEISTAAMELIGEFWNIKNPVRAVTVTGCGLVPADSGNVQLSLFEEAAEDDKRRDDLEKTMDNLRTKFGKGIIDFGYNQKNEV